MSNRYSIGAATVLMLVALRLTIGWHFFSEGIKHHADPRWTSERELRAARGPLAGLYHSYLPDFHGFEELLHGQPSETDEHAVQSWVDEVQKDWDADRQQYSGHYGLDERQQKQAAKVLAAYQVRLRDWASANRDALATHVHEWQRKESSRQQSSGEVPYQKKRVAERHLQLDGEASGWLADLRGMEHDYHNALRALASDESRQMPLGEPASSIDRIDGVLTYVILAVGLLLLLGLFTRTAAVAGALFLLSVVMMQPFWVSGAVPTYNQYVEMFALLTLATTQVGRWGGLDFFVANLISGSKGKPDASQS